MKLTLGDHIRHALASGQITRETIPQIRQAVDSGMPVASAMKMATGGSYTDPTSGMSQEQRDFYGSGGNAGSAPTGVTTLSSGPEQGINTDQLQTLSSGPEGMETIAQSFADQPVTVQQAPPPGGFSANVGPEHFQNQQASITPQWGQGVNFNQFLRNNQFDDATATQLRQAKSSGMSKSDILSGFDSGAWSTPNPQPTTQSTMATQSTPQPTTQPQSVPEPFPELDLPDAPNPYANWPQGGAPVAQPKSGGGNTFDAGINMTGQGFGGSNPLPTGFGEWGHIGTGNPGGMGSSFNPHDDPDSAGPFGNSTPVYTVQSGWDPNAGLDFTPQGGGPGAPPPPPPPTTTPQPGGTGPTNVPPWAQGNYSPPSPLSFADPNQFQTQAQGQAPSAWGAFSQPDFTGGLGPQVNAPSRFQRPDLQQGSQFNAPTLGQMDPALFQAAQASAGSGGASAGRARAQQAGRGMQADGSFDFREVALQGINAPSLADVEGYSDMALDYAKRSMDPQWESDKRAFDQQMVSQGIYPGTEAYNTAYGNFARARNDAYNSARFGAFTTGTALQEQMFRQGLDRAVADLQAQMSNQGADISLGESMGRASIANANNDNSRRIANAQFGTQANIANADNKTRASIASSNNRANIAMANAQLENAMRMQQLGLANERDVLNAQMEVEAARFGESQRQFDNSLASDIARQENQFGLDRAALQNTINDTRFDNILQRRSFNAENDWRAQQDEMARAGFLQDQYLDNNRLEMDRNAQNFAMMNETDRLALEQMLGLDRNALTARGQDLTARGQNINREIAGMEADLRRELARMQPDQNISAEDLNRIYNSGLDEQNMQAMQLALQALGLFQQGDTTFQNWMFG